MREAGRAFQRGQELAWKGRAQEASQSFAEAVSLGAGPAAEAHWALALSNLGQTPEALLKIQDARDAEPQNPACQAFEALIRLDHGDQKKAAELARDVIRRHPENQMAYGILALIDWQSGRYGEAIESLGRVGLCDNVDLRSRLAVEIQARMPEDRTSEEEGAAEADEATVGSEPDLTDRDPGRPFLARLQAKRSLDRGVRLLYRGEARSALPHLERARGLSPDLGGLAYHLGVIYVELGRIDAAEAELSRVGQGDFFAIQAEFLRSVCRLRKGEFEEAERSLIQLRDSSGSKPQLHDFQEYIPWLLGDIALRRGDAAEARRRYHEALSLWGPLLEQQLTEATKLFRAGKYPKQDPPGLLPDAPSFTTHGHNYPISGGQSVSSEEEKKDVGSEPEETPTPEAEEGGGSLHQETPEEGDSPEEQQPDATDPARLPGEGSSGEGVDEEGEQTGPAEPDAERTEEHEESAGMGDDETPAGEPPPEAPSTGTGEDDLSPIVPVPAEGVVCLEHDDTPTQRFYLLVRREEHVYLRISSKERFIWRQMDGQANLSEIAAAYHDKHGSLGVRHVRKLYEKLLERGFVTSGGEDAKSAEADALRGEVASAMGRLAFRLIGPQSGSKLLDGLHRVGGPLLGTGQVQGVLGILGLAGLAAFVASMAGASSAESYQFLELAGTYSFAIIALYIWNVVGSAIHELGRGMSLKASHCDVVSAGAALRFAFLGFYIDIRDSQRLLRKLRVAVLLSGAALEAFAAGLCGVAAINLPPSMLRDVLALGAGLLGFRVFLHASPFWRSDLYSAATEASDNQHLRQAALKFLRPRYWLQLWQKSRWERKELLLLSFGLWIVVWLTGAAKLAGFILQTQVTNSAVSDILDRLVRGSTGQLLDAIVAILLILLVAIPAVFFLVLSIVYICASTYRAIRQSERSKGPLFLVIAFGVVSLCLGYLGKAASVLGYMGGGAQVSKLAALTVSALVVVGGLVFAIFLFRRTRRELDPVLKSRIGFALVVGSVAVILCSHGAMFHGSLESSRPFLLAAGTLLSAVAILIVGYNFLVSVATPFALPWLGMGVALAICLGRGYGPSLGIFGGDGAPSGALKEPFQLIGATWFFLTCGWSLWFVARTRPLDLPAPAEAKAETDTSLLVSAFNYTLSTLLKNLKTYGGKGLVSSTKAAIAPCAEPHEITLDYDNESGTLIDPVARKDDDFDSLADPLREIVLIAVTMGRTTTGAEGLGNILRGIQRNLPWDERDALTTHLLRDPRWAAALTPSQDFPKGDRVKLLGSTFLFQQFEEEELEQIASIVSTQSFHTGEDVICQDDPGDEAFVIQKGGVDILVEDEIGGTHLVAVLGPGDFFGEMALLEDAPRSATVRAREDLQVLVLDRPIFERFVERYGEAKEKLAEAVRALRLILKMPLFEEFSTGETASVATKFRLERYEEGRSIITQGETGEHFYLIHEGSADVVIQTDDGEERLRTLRPGEYFGEIALLQDVPRTATIKAAEPTAAFSLSKSDFLSLLGGHPCMVSRLEREKARRETTIKRRTGQHEAIS